MTKLRSTTILGVRANARVAIGGDGQVTFGETILKSGASKIRRLGGGKVLAGFAGSTADALTLFEKFESHLSEHPGNLARASVELAKEWRGDRILRRLEALLAVMDADHSFIISGSGDVVEPDDQVLAIGSGGPYALAAARALLRHSDLDAKAVVETALGIAAEICIYSNDRLVVYELNSGP